MVCLCRISKTKRCETSTKIVKRVWQRKSGPLYRCARHSSSPLRCEVPHVQRSHETCERQPFSSQASNMQLLLVSVCIYTMPRTCLEVASPEGKKQSRCSEQSWVKKYGSWWFLTITIIPGRIPFFLAFMMDQSRWDHCPRKPWRST